MTCIESSLFQSPENYSEAAAIIDAHPLFEVIKPSDMGMGGYDLVIMFRLTPMKELAMTTHVSGWLFSSFTHYLQPFFLSLLIMLFLL